MDKTESMTEGRGEVSGAEAKMDTTGNNNTGVFGGHLDRHIVCYQRLSCAWQSIIKHSLQIKSCVALRNSVTRTENTDTSSCMYKNSGLR